MRHFIIAGQVLVWLIQLAPSHATSFNCRPYLDRRACPELMICTNARLSRLDEIMASLYEDVRSRMQDSMRTGFRDYQREWLARRGSCGCDYDCLDSEYRSQIDGLSRTLNQMDQ